MPNEASSNATFNILPEQIHRLNCEQYFHDVVTAHPFRYIPLFQFIWTMHAIFSKFDTVSWIKDSPAYPPFVFDSKIIPMQPNRYKIEVYRIMINHLMRGKALLRPTGVIPDIYTSALVTIWAPCSLAALPIAKDTEPIPPSTYLQETMVFKYTCSLRGTWSNKSYLYKSKCMMANSITTKLNKKRRKH